MRRIRIAGLCLVAVFVMSAIASATASATLPEYGKCLKKAVAGGSGYSNSGCTKAVTGATAKYEWVAGDAGIKFSTVGTAATLLTTKGETVTCTSESSTGTYLGGNNKEEETTVNFAGCKSNGLTCTTTGDAAGELTTNPLIGIIGYEKLPTATAGKTDLQLHPATSGGHFIDFKCTSALTIEVRGAEGANGGILVPIKNDKMTSLETLKYTQSKGKQKPTKWIAPGFSENQFLESNFQSTGFGQSGQTVTTKVTNEGGVKLEIKAI
jgi:hypothetical protein